MQLRLIPKLSLGLFVLLLQLFLFINADAFYGASAEAVKDIILVYLLLQVSVIAITGFKPELMKTGIEGVWRFAFIFLVSAFIFLVFPPVKFGFTFQSLIGIVIIQCFVVAYTEEMVFRSMLPAIMKSDLWAAGMFGLFHFAVYGASWIGIIIAVIFGLAFAFIRDKFGIFGAVGVHTSFNLKSLGILDALISGQW